jgi:hypothetical protein
LVASAWRRKFFKLELLSSPILTVLTAPSRPVRKSLHNTASGYPKNYKRSQKLTIKTIRSVNLDQEAPKVLILDKSEWAGGWMHTDEELAAPWWKKNIEPPYYSKGEWEDYPRK